MRLPVLQNFQSQCTEDVQKALKREVPLQELVQTYCTYCRNPECSEAQWATSQWEGRILSQEDRLLINPRFSDLTSGAHQDLHTMNFKSLFQKAMQLEIADRRGDWEPITGGFEEDYVSADGKDEVSETGADAVEAAMEAFRKSKPPVKVPKLGGGLEDPTVFQPQKREAPPQRTASPSPKPESVPEVVGQAAASVPQPSVPVVESPPPQQVSKTAEASPEQPTDRAVEGFRTLLLAFPGVEDVALQEDGKIHVRCQPTVDPKTLPETLGQTEVVYHKIQPQVAQSFNTHVPAEGIMIGGGPSPTPASSQPQHDPWAVPAPPKDNVVKPGAKIKMGGGNHG